MNRMTADELRRGFLGFFERRGHTVVPSASLIPHDPDLLFTVAGMVPFKPYFLGEEAAPWPRATSVQKCVRAGGKDSDLEEVGRDGRHLSFFQMLGNFSFGDYFKPEAIPMAWELVTEVLGIDPDQLWVTVHTTDDEAEQIWLDAVGIDPTRIQRLGADNWWGPPGGPPGPCGPCTEIYVDKGPRYGADGGPAHGGEERFLEIWNLVFMQFNRDADGVDHELPRKNIDTGAGLERILGVLQGVDDVYEIDEFVPIVDEAQRLTGHRLGADAAADVSLRILAEHARTVAFLVSDGVFPSNNGRGYVLRRILRRAVRHAFLLGVEDLVTPELIGTVAQVMGDAYPDLRANVDFVQSVVGREEESFRRTLRQGLAILDSELADVGAGGSLGGSVAFTLHDTHGFPLELTEEIAAEHDVAVDRDGFEAEMQAQRSRAKADRAAKGGGVDLEPYLDVLEQFGATEFTGRQEDESKARVLAVVPVDADASDETSHWVVLDRTPFYAESGGQVGDTGTIRAGDLVVDVTDTTYAVPGQLIRHAVRLDGAALAPGAEVVAAIDADRRAAIRRNHTATHLLHWALREVLGDHVKQQGSLVAPDRLRFDFSHYEAVTPEQLARIEDLVNGDVLANSPTRHFETTMDAAQQLGAIAFFGDKYGDIVRVLEAGPHSTELCGGTHVHALGDIGAVKVISEASIGSNIRRLEAVTGFGPIERLRQDEQRLSAIADVLGVGVDEAVLAVERRNAEVKELQRELRTLRQRLAATQATELAATAVDGVVVARVDGTSRDDLRDLALAVRDVAGIRAAVLGGAPDGGGAALVAAVAPGADLDAGALIADAAKAIKGGGGRNPDLAIAGGKDPAGLDEALAQVRAVAGR
ncbi:MAG: alanine--tRNA ligase [Acidimicrobiales bacterium]|nr:alanine--tRNA ligase [Acidimicrobiales bacterium]